MFIFESEDTIHHHLWILPYLVRARSRFQYIHLVTPKPGSFLMITVPLIRHASASEEIFPQLLKTKIFCFLATHMALTSRTWSIVTISWRTSAVAIDAKIITLFTSSIAHVRLRSFPPPPNWSPGPFNFLNRRSPPTRPWRSRASNLFHPPRLLQFNHVTLTRIDMLALCPTSHFSPLTSPRAQLIFLPIGITTIELCCRPLAISSLPAEI